MRWASESGVLWDLEVDIPRPVSDESRRVRTAEGQFHVGQARRCVHIEAQVVHHALGSQIQLVDRNMQGKQPSTERLGQGAHLIVAPRPRLTEVMAALTKRIKRRTDERRGRAKTTEAFDEETQQASLTLGLDAANAAGPAVGKNAGDPLFQFCGQEGDLVSDGRGRGCGVRGWGDGIAFNVGGGRTVHDLNQGITTSKVGQEGVPLPRPSDAPGTSPATSTKATGT